MMDNQKRVLVVDDDEEVLFVWASALRKLPELRVDTATNGSEALDRFKEDFFDLVVTDLAMPVMDGIALTRAIRETNTCIPIIWVTAYSQLHDSFAECDLKVYSFLSKPVSIQEIRDVVRQALDPACSNGNTIDGLQDGNT